MKNLIHLQNRRKVINEISFLIYKKLPDDILHYIYKEFIEIELMYIEFVKDLNKRESLKLCIIFIRPWIPIILGKPKFLNYLKLNIKSDDGSYIFNSVIKSRINNRKQFFNAKNKGDSFALEILFNLYH